MPLSNSVLRRYTPPTCTLEVVAKNSPLSRWAGQSVLKDLRFELRFDDPRKLEDERVTIRGDRTELEILTDAVHRYVQEFLELPATQLPSLLGSPTTTNNPALAENLHQEYGSQSAPDVNPIEPVSEEQIDQTANPSAVRNLNAVGSLPDPNPEMGSKIYLQPRGLLGHDLFLGRLANQESGPVIDLSVLQLFDLATALDEFAADGVALPSLTSPVRSNKSLPPWTRTAAAVLLTAGVTTAAVKVLDQRHSNQQAAAPTANQTPILSKTPLISQVPPAPTTPLPIAPLPTPVLPPSIASSPKLAPPTPVTVPVTPTLGGPQARERPTLTVVPPPTNTLAAPQRPAPGVIPGSSAITPGSIASRPNPRVTSRNNSSTAPSVTSRSNSSTTPSAKTSARQSTTSVPATPPPLPTDLPSLSTSPPEVASNAPTSRAVDSASSQSNPAAYAPTANSQKNTLFDNIPQVAEVRSYFQQRWKPPASLNKTLEYSLLLNGDGSIQRITPLGKTAGDYIDRTGMPLPGEAFVSPVSGGGNPRIRLVLAPDGKVQAFIDQ